MPKIIAEVESNDMKNIIVTGANRGIGFEITKRYLELGHRVWASYRNKSNAKDLLSMTKSFHNLTAFEMDVTNQESIEIAFDDFLQSNLKFEVLFNNAGIIDWSDFENVEPKSFADVYEVNVIGAFMVMRNSLKTLHQNSHIKSRIINLSSRLGSIELRGNTQLGGALAYQCSKAALNMLTRQTSLELKPKGISVISMSPGWVKTDMGGKNAKYETDQSVTMILSVLQSLADEETGIFIGEDGEIIPW